MSLISIVPAKSHSDNRHYRYLQLANGLEALLVHDSETDKAAAAMDVHVGHFSDPASAPGLAHFLEHMLFLGTQKYPDENSYSVYLNENGGSSNAFTSMENTNYYFDVKSDHLEGALDRFAQFFIAPRFTPSATDREMNAVHSENAKNQLNDSWRLFQLTKSTANPLHPFSKFGTGNLSTLRDDPVAAGIDVRALLLRFHQEFYSASIMKLAVLGKESLDELEHMVREKFSGVSTTGRQPPTFEPDAFTPAQLQKLYRIVPVKDLRSLDLFWPLPPTRRMYRLKPTSCLSHLVGHEAEGSLLSYLKRKGWANGLSSGGQHSTTAFSGFAVSVELTPEGLDHTEEVTQSVFQYLEMLRRASDEKWHMLYKENSVRNRRTAQ